MACSKRYLGHGMVGEGCLLFLSAIWPHGLAIFRLVRRRPWVRFQAWAFDFEIEHVESKFYAQNNRETFRSGSVPLPSGGLAETGPDEAYCVYEDDTEQMKLGKIYRNACRMCRPADF